MPSQIRIKTQFVSSVLKSTAEEIRKKQTEVVDQWDLFETGNLRNMLQRHFSVSARGEGGKLSMRYLAYARWLDMQDNRRKSKREGFHLYNRLIFGYLYNNTLPQLEFGFTEEIRNQINQRLLEIENMKLPFYRKTNLKLKEISHYNRNFAAAITKTMRVGYR